jgi:cyclic pyranopterin phosphate synthase
MTKLTHLDDEGRASMVDVGAKQVTQREAVARARVVMSPATLGLVESAALPKGDVLATARIAGILAAKATPSLVPLTHPIQITSAEIAFEVDRDRSAIDVIATVRCEGKTGVEIEAMTASAIAAVTIYDMCKSAEKGIVIESIALERKSGGKSGTWTR